jgi:hypothetical protein
MDVDMIMNVVKYDTNKRWVIHNYSPQEVGNPQLLENLFLKKRGSPHLIPKKI